MAFPERAKLIILDDHLRDLRQDARQCWTRSSTTHVLRSFLRRAFEVGASLGIDVKIWFEDSISSPPREPQQQQAPGMEQQFFLSYILGIAAILLTARQNDSWFAGSGAKSVVIGFGPGLLCAVVLAASTSTDDLAGIGMEIAPVAARLSCAIAARTRQNQRDAAEGEPSMLTISRLGSAELGTILECFHEQHKIPRHRHAYVAVDDGAHSTVCGPPSTLALLMAEPALSSNCSPRYDTWGAGSLHAAHLPELQHTVILDGFDQPWRAVGSRCEIWSPTSCSPYETKDCGKLLRLIVHDIAQRLCRPAQTIAECVTKNAANQARVQIVDLGAGCRVQQVRAELRCVDAVIAEEDEIFRWATMENDDVGGRDDSRSIAIVGMSGRFPGSEHIHGFWQSLHERRTFHKKVPSDRYNLEDWLAQNHASRTGSAAPLGCFIERAGHFDADFFHMLPAEASRLDPTQRLSLMVAYEALESAGALRATSRMAGAGRGEGGGGSGADDFPRQQTCATFCGQCANDWNVSLKQRPLDAYYLSSVCRAFTSGRINYSLQLEGPAYTLDCACSSSAAAITLACSALRNGECDVALAGGSNVLASPEPYVGLAQGSYLSPGGPCRPFHRDADGYCRGEAVAFVVLKRLDDAIRDHDHVHAVISGYARTQSSAARVRSIVHSDAHGQAQTFRAALADAGLDPAQVGYVEAHGTGTTLGDAAELEALAAVFTSASRRLVVGSVKANIGHTEAASGVCSVIRAIGIQQSGRIPAMPDTACDPDPLCAGGQSIRIATTDTVLGPDAPHVLVNNPDAAGGNAALIVSPPPAACLRPPRRPAVPSQPASPGVVIVLSAQSAPSLLANISSLQRYLQEDRDGPDFLGQLAYSLSARRLHHRVRKAWHVATVAELHAALATARAEIQPAWLLLPSPGIPTSAADRRRAVFVCGGQGGEVATAGRDLYEHSAAFRAAIDDYRGICRVLSYPDPIHIVTGRPGGGGDDCNSQLASHLGLVAFELGLVRVWREYGLEPALVMGHSLGEYTALCASGMLSVTDTFYLVGARARLLDEQRAHMPSETTMLAVAIAADEMQRLLGLWSAQHAHPADAVVISCDNGPRSCVCAGPRTEIEHLQSYLANDVPDRGVVHSQILPLPFGYHSPAVDPILSTYRTLCDGVKLHPAKIPFCSSLDARVRDIGQSLGNGHLPAQARGMVNFRKAVLAAAEFTGPLPAWIEIGPGAQCSSFAQDTFSRANRPGKALPSCAQGLSCRTSLSRALAAMYEAGADIAWHQVCADWSLPATLLPDLPCYAFNLREYPIRIDGPAHFTTTTPNQRPVFSAPLPFTPTATLDQLESLAWESSGDVVAKFRSSLQNRMLQALSDGHQVSGIAVCPMSALSDLAVTAAHYLLGQLQSEHQLTDLIVRHLRIDEPVRTTTQHRGSFLRVSAATQLADPNEVRIHFETVDPPPASPRAIGSCSISCRDKRRSAQPLPQADQNMLRRMNTIRTEAQSGRGQCITSPLVYMLFENSVRYAAQYRCVQGVFIAESMREAVATATLTDHGTSHPGSFAWDPYWTDGLTHMAGFLANLSLLGDVQERVCIASEVSSVQIYVSLAPGVRYDIYVELNPGEHHAAVQFADVFIMHGEKLHAWCSKIKFTAMPRGVARRILASKAEDEIQSNIMTPVNLHPPPTSSDSMERPRERAKDGREKMAQAVLSALSSNLGINDAQQLKGSTSFSDLGLDSLTSLATVAEVNRAHGLDLPGAFYILHNTRDSVLDYFGCVHNDEVPADSCASSSEDGFRQSDSSLTSSCCPRDNTTPASSTILKAADSEALQRTSSSTLIHGKKSSGLAPLFFVPDAMGSPISFLQLPLLNGGRCLYALESPFARDPDAARGYGVADFARYYVQAILQVQANGPFFIGGYSAGAFFAVEVARQLADADHEVAGLFIVDMHAPKPHDITGETLTLVAKHSTEVLSLLNLGPARHVVEAHMAMIVETVVRYDGAPLSPKQQPKQTLIVWVLQPNPRAQVPPDLQNEIQPNQIAAFRRMRDWFADGHPFSGPEGWELIVGPRVRCAQIDTDHFSILLPPAARALVQEFEVVMSSSD